MAVPFTKYRGGIPFHWQETSYRSILSFNAFADAQYRVALDALGDVQGKTVVDIGAGDGALTARIVQKGARVIAIDNDREGLDLARNLFHEKGLHAEFVYGDAEEIPLPNSCADAVMASEVIEHLDHPQRFLQEAARILRPGGTLVVTTPYRLTEHPPQFHVHEFYPEELKALVELLFTSVTVRETHNLFWYTLSTYRFRTLRKLQVGKWIVNIMALWFGCNPFLRDSRDRNKWEYYGQITLSAQR